MSKDSFVNNLQQIKTLEKYQAKIEEQEQIIAELKHKRMITKKKLLKFVQKYDDPFFLEVLSHAADTRRRQLNPGFQSETIKG